MTTAVVILASTKAFTVPGWVLMFGVMLAAVVGAIAQWVVSARTKRQAAIRLAAVAVVLTVSFVAFPPWDCGWLYDWICWAFV